MGNSLTRKRRAPGQLREVLAQNINRLMEQRYAAVANRSLALAKDAGVSLSTVQRTLSREASATVDVVEAFAKALLPGLPSFQLLVPWGMLGQISVEAVSERTDATRKPLFAGNRRESREKRERKRATAR